MAPEDAGAVDTDRLPPAPAQEPATQTSEPQSASAAAPTEAKASDTVAAEDVASEAKQLTTEERARYQEAPGPNVEVPSEAPQPTALEPTEDAEAVYQEVLAEQLGRGSSPQVAEARARVARAKAERGIKRGPTPVQVAKPVPSAPTKNSGGTAAPPGDAPSGPASESPDSGGTAEPPGDAPTPASASGSETPEQVYERVLAEQRDKGSSEVVAVARAKSARFKAEKAAGGS
jgi:hypothetical protein